MATIADFRTSVSQLSQDKLLETIRTIRSLRRILSEKKLRATKTTKATKTKKTPNISSYVENLNNNEKQAMLTRLLEIRKKGN